MKHNGVSAFPRTNYRPDGSGIIENGMTLRDYFAAKAMQGLIAYEGDSERFQGIAREAYAHADAMLEARK